MQFDPATHPLHLDKPTRKIGRLDFVKIQCTWNKIFIAEISNAKDWIFQLYSPWNILEAAGKNNKTSIQVKDVSFGYRLRQPEANASIGKHVGLLVAPVKSKDRAQAKVMTDYKEDQTAGNLAKFEKCTEILEIFQRILKKLKDISSIISRRKHRNNLWKWRIWDPYFLCLKPCFTWRIPYTKQWVFRRF